ncbi:hypothetical protein VNO77_03251 [Canavalia gladiata]|uniref:Uncharacterized protein n=1 Tax=Canavalia gladiata TaxID=3824 RepID=A0AAN9R7Z1_CANGL
MIFCKAEWTRVLEGARFGRHWGWEVKSIMRRLRISDFSSILYNDFPPYALREVQQTRFYAKQNKLYSVFLSSVVYMGEPRLGNVFATIPDMQWLIERINTKFSLMSLFCPLSEMEKLPEKGLSLILQFAQSRSLSSQFPQKLSTPIQRSLGYWSSSLDQEGSKKKRRVDNLAAFGEKRKVRLIADTTQVFRMGCLAICGTRRRITFLYIYLEILSKVECMAPQASHAKGRRTGWVSLLVAVRKSLEKSMTVSHFLVNVTTCHHHYVSDLDKIIGAPKMRTGTLAREDYEAQI